MARSIIVQLLGSKGLSVLGPLDGLLLQLFPLRFLLVDGYPVDRTVFFVLVFSRNTALVFLLLPSHSVETFLYIRFG